MNVSVLMLSYNHAPFVRQALDSALMQRADFDWEIVVGDDCSTDDTAAIVRQYGRRHPERVRVLTRARNVGMHRNFAETLAACRGRYVAMLEGDDYWTAPDKLRRQVELLDARPGHALCFHDVEVIHADGSRPPYVLRPPEARETWTIDDLLRWNFVPNCSVMFRRDVLGELPAWFDDVPIPDWTLHLLHAERGTLGHLAAVMAAYRVHAGGVFSSQTEIRRTEAIIEVYRRIGAHLGGRRARVARRRIADAWYGLAATCAERGELATARVYGRRCLVTPPLTGYWWPRAKLLVRLYAPALWRAGRGARRTLGRKRCSPSSS